MSDLNRLRVLARLAWRETLYRKGRLLIVTALIAVATGLATVAAFTMAGDNPGLREAKLVAEAQWWKMASGFKGKERPTKEQERLVSRILERGVVSRNFTINFAAIETTSGVVYPASVSFTDAVSEPELSTVSILEGDEPRPGEVVLSPGLADELSVRPGDDIRLARPQLSARVAGIGNLKHTDYLEHELIVMGKPVDSFPGGRVPPQEKLNGSWTGNPSLTLLNDVGTITSEEAQALRKLRWLPASEDSFLTENGDDWTPTDNSIFSFALIILIAAAGVVIWAAFATSLRRHLVTSGQLATQGADSDSVLTVLALQGAWSGLVGGLAGVGLSTAGLQFALSRQRETAPLLDAFPVSRMALILGASVVVSTIAAAIPAAIAVRAPILAALSGARPTRKIPGFMAPAGVISIVCSTLILALAQIMGRPGYENDLPAALMSVIVTLAAIGIVAGVCLLGPLVAGVIGQVRSRSVSMNLAARSIRRSVLQSTALFGVSALLCGLVAVAAALAGASAQINLAQGTFGDGGISLSTDLRTVRRDGRKARAFQETLRKVEQILPDAKRVEWKTARPPREGWGPRPTVATAAWVREFSFTKHAVDTLSRDGLIAPRARPHSPANVPDFARLPTEILARGMVSPERVKLDGLESYTTGAVFMLDHPLTFDERKRLSHAAGGFEQSAADRAAELFPLPGDRAVPTKPYSFRLGVYNQDPGLRFWRWLPQLFAAGSGLLLGLVVILAMMLTRAENARDRTALRMVGAPPKTMRRSDALGMMMLVGAAALLGAGVLLAVMNALRHLTDTTEGVLWLGPPWSAALLLVVGVPLDVAAATYLTSFVQGTKPADEVIRFE